MQYFCCNCGVLKNFARSEIHSNVALSVVNALATTTDCIYKYANKNYNEASTSVSRTGLRRHLLSWLKAE